MGYETSTDPAPPPQGSHPERFGAPTGAHARAQLLAFAPLFFQAARCARDLGLLSALERAGGAGLTPDEAAQAAGISRYAAHVLLEACASLELAQLEEGRYRLLDTGRLVLHDPMVRVNFDFTHDVCYRAGFRLRESLEQGRPAGLRELGPWPTVYEGLTHLPEAAKQSWFAFDHFYSDRIFHLALGEIVARSAASLLDVGCNTGRWSALASRTMTVTGVDHEAQLRLAGEHVAAHGCPSRFTAAPLDLLDHSKPFPEGFDAVWMSQLLDCFSEADIERLLARAKSALTPNGRVYVVETFWDRQRSAPPRIALHGTSLYFTCVANGESRMYQSDDVLVCARAAGLEVELDRPLGPWHTLLVLRGDRSPSRPASPS
ncbi:MAG: class I SAM-dependent methyltransferase [Archangiaceae bacterium]|nr:class I SAM-dependent methyltransferase [Archangiaceae bacterium]